MTRSERFAKDKQGITITADQRHKQERKSIPKHNSNLK